MDSSSGHSQEMRTSSEQSLSMARVGPTKGGAAAAVGERKPRPQGEQALKCPRCESANTKFCYYNNYSLTQPRYFCKSCRRYWTKGGTLRNVPVGGGCRKNRRPSSSSSSSSASKRGLHDHHHLINTSSTTASFPILPPPLLPPPPTSSSSYDQNDLTLAFSRLHNDQQLCSMFGTASSGFLDALKTGFLDSTPSHQYSGINNNYYGQSYDNNNNNDDDDNNDRIALNDHHNHHQNMIKNELCNGNYNTTAGNDNHNNRVLWGLPWQLNGSSSEHHHNVNGNIGNMVDFDGSTTTSTNGSGREFWSGFGSSNWHGLLNTTPLM